MNYSSKNKPFKLYTLLIKYLNIKVLHDIVKLDTVKNALNCEDEHERKIHSMFVCVYVVHVVIEYIIVIVVYS